MSLDSTGTANGATRQETDTFGPIAVPADRYWGAQSQRSIGNFKIGWEKQPKAVVRALGIVKRAAAEANMALGRLYPGEADLANGLLVCVTETTTDEDVEALAGALAQEFA